MNSDKLSEKKYMPPHISITTTLHQVKVNNLEMERAKLSARKQYKKKKEEEKKKRKRKKRKKKIKIEKIQYLKFKIHWMDLTVE